MHSLSPYDALVGLAATFDDGMNDTVVLDLGRVPLPGGERAEVLVDLREAGLVLSRMQVSGRIHVTATLQDLETGAVEQTTSPALFFHPEGDRLRTYDEETLRSEFASGDFLGKFPIAWERARGDYLLGETLIPPVRHTIGGRGVVTDGPPSDSELEG